MKALRTFPLCLLLLFTATVQGAGGALAPLLIEQPWTDSDGRELRLGSLHAPVVVVTMAYTACRKVCGTTTLVLAELQKRLDALHVEADIVVVSYDPASDSPADWRDYRARRGFTRANWHFLTGSPAATRMMARSLDLDYWTYHEHLVHDFRIVLYDARWRTLSEVDWAHLDRLDAVLAHVPAPAASGPADR